MSIEDLLKDKTKKAKEKVATLSSWILDGSLALDEFLAVAEKQKEADKGTCIEAIEFATRQNSDIADESLFDFVTKSMGESQPRVKWESAKVIGNIAHLFPDKLNKAIKQLLAHTDYDGTVVKWATAFALGEILKLKTKHNKELLPKIIAIFENEEDNAIKKKYLEAIKKASK